MFYSSEKSGALSISTVGSQKQSRIIKQAVELCTVDITYVIFKNIQKMVNS